MKPGDKVTYIPHHSANLPQAWRHGIIKSVTPDGAAFFVVYNCAGEWHNYKQYTAARTNPADLRPGWLDIDAYDLFMPRGEKLRI